MRTVFYFYIPALPSQRFKNKKNIPNIVLHYICVQTHIYNSLKPYATKEHTVSKDYVCSQYTKADTCEEENYHAIAF